MLVKEELCDSAAEVAVDEEAGGGAAASPTGESVSQAPPPGYKWWHGELVKMCPEEIKMLREHLHPDEKRVPSSTNQGGRTGVCCSWPYIIKNVGTSFRELWISSLSTIPLPSKCSA